MSRFIRQGRRKPVDDSVQKLVVHAACGGESLERSDRVKVTQDWVLSRLMANVESALAEEDRSAANRGLEILAKHLGMFDEKAGVDDAQRQVTIREVRE